jgi:hypothetical protein
VFSPSFRPDRSPSATEWDGFRCERVELVDPERHEPAVVDVRALEERERGPRQARSQGIELTRIGREGVFVTLADDRHRLAVGRRARAAW